MEYVVQLLSGAAGAAIVAGVFGMIQARKQKADAHTEALRYIMLYVIQERAKQYIADGAVSIEDRRLLHKWHDTYHNGLEGNGDADALMRAVDALPLKIGGNNDGNQN